MQKIELKILGMSSSQTQVGAYALILGEVNGRRRLPIIIGGFEAQAIAIGLEKLKPTRPLTHDLFKNFAEAYNIIIKEIIIDKFIHGVFFAKLICFDGKSFREIDSRTSDAVALAIRYECPIYTYEKILSEAGIIIDEESQIEEKDDLFNDVSDEEHDNIDLKNEFSGYSLNELSELLSEAVENEDYEKASLIRDEINKRKQNK